MFRLLTVSDAEDWQTFLPARKNVFGSVEYARIVQGHSNYAARLFVATGRSSLIAYPFFARPVSELPFGGEVAPPAWDTTSPEYTGPISLGFPADADSFRVEWNNFCREQGVVAEFAHLYPWDIPADALDPAGLEFDREIIYINTQLSEQELWEESFTYGCRKNIRRALGENVRVTAATNTEEIRAFHQIYSKTMERNQALKKYFFPLEYFLQFFQQLPENARFAMATYEGRIIAGTLYLYDDTNVYSYLGGADALYQHVRPSNAIVYDTIQWARQSGKQRVILGGGYKPDDGIYRFKASFSPLRAKFFTYRHIHVPDKYGALHRAWANYYGQEPGPGPYFPVYRTPAPFKSSAT